MATGDTIQFPSPIEEALFKIVQDSHLIKNSKQFLPLFRTNEINQQTLLPAMVPVVIERRRSADCELMEADILLTIWDLFHGFDECESEHDIHMAAINLNANYQNDLMQIIDCLVDGVAGCYYNFVGPQRFIPRYKIDAFDKFLEGKEHPFRKKLFGSSVLFTVNGPVGCIRCSPVFNSIDEETCEGC